MIDSTRAIPYSKRPLHFSAAPTIPQQFVRAVMRGHNAAENSLEVCALVQGKRKGFTRALRHNRGESSTELVDNPVGCFRAPSPSHPRQRLFSFPLNF
jgi:hypothetical protein